MLKMLLFVLFAVICLAMCGRCGSDDSNDYNYSDTSYSEGSSYASTPSNSEPEEEPAYVPFPARVPAPVAENKVDDKTAKENVKIAELKEYLATKGLDLCSIYDIIGAMERRNGEIADEKFPDNAISRSMYQESLNEKDRAMLTEKYGFEEMTIMEINWYGTKECF